MLNDEIKTKVACQKLLGYTTVRHIDGYYIATQTSLNRANIYNDKFEPILIGISLSDISKDFILVQEEGGDAVYTSNGEILAKTSVNERIELLNNIVYVFNRDILAQIITISGGITTDIPNVSKPICNVSKNGNVYTLDTQGNLYLGKQIIDSGLQYSNTHFSEYYYAKFNDNKITVYDLDTHEVILEQYNCELQISNDKILVEIKEQPKKFYIYDKGFNEIKLPNYVSETGFICDHEGNPKLIICRKGNKYRLANMQGEILIKKEYNSIDVKMYGKYVRVQSSNHAELRDINGKLALTAEFIVPTDYGMVVINNGVDVVLDCEELRQL